MTKPSRKHGDFGAGSEPVAVVYAKALLGALESTGQTESAMQELESLIVDCLDNLPQFEATLASLRVPHEDKVALLDKAFHGRMNPVLLSFLKVTSQHGRLDCLRAIFRAAQRLLAEMQGRVEVHVATATEIDDDLELQIAGTLQTALGRQVDLETEVQADLIGGMVVRIGDSVYDASVVNELRRLRDGVLTSTSQAIQGALERFAGEEK
jgi:F-type H+-transporting ATPase subunit delta